MSKPIAIISGEPNSISSEIIFKLWKSRKKFAHRPFLIIGSMKLLNLQKKKLRFNISIKEIKKNFDIKDLKGKFLPVYNVEYEQKKAFQKISVKSKKYIFNCFKEAQNFISKKKVSGLINCPVSKEILFKNKKQGVTEFLAKKAGIQGNEVMLIYNKKLSVAPLTTHIPLREVSNKIDKLKILKKIITINNFYRKNFKKKPIIGILGLNPHNHGPTKNSEEKNNIIPAIKLAKKNNIKIFGPVSTDTAFLIDKKNKFDVIFGMYHDQVLTPFKAMYKYKAINITLGLSYIRVSPDHGIAEDIVGKKIANPESLIESVKFFNYIKNK